MKAFIKDMAERAIKTFAQTAAASLSIEGLAFEDVNWVHILSVAGMAALLSVLMSIGSYNFGDKGTASIVKK